jgi:hypothetical protein
MRYIFGQPVNKIHPREIMDEKKIFIVNLAKGVIGDDAARGARTPAIMDSRGRVLLPPRRLARA